MAAAPHPYDASLLQYLHARDESALYRASLLGQQFVEAGLGPDDIVALHSEALAQAVQSLPARQAVSASVDALQFLLEVMIAFGVHHQRYLELRLAEQSQAMAVAAAQQQQCLLDAEQADQEKSAILAAIAHELRSPVTAARGLIDLATRALDREQPARALPPLSSARAALDRLVRLAADLVEASRGDAPRLTLAPHNLADTVQQAVTWARTAALEKGIVLTLVGDGALPPLLVSGDADALHTILMNLLTNAIRYTPAGGQVTVRTELRSEDAVVTVADTGIGMPPEVQARLFEKFYRADAARQQVAQGLGLGLFLVKQLVDQHQGQLHVTSTPGQGSAFTLTLPLAR